MKFLKNTLSTIIYLLIRIILFIIPLMFIYQTLTKEETVDKLLSAIINTSLTRFNISTEENIDGSTLNEYIDQEELESYYKEFIKEYIESLTSGGEIPNLNNEEFQQLIEEASSKYEEATGNPVDLSGVQQEIDKSNEKLKESQYLLTIPQEIKKIINYRVKTSHIIILIVIEIILIIVLYLITKNIKNIVNFLSKIFLLKTIFLILLTFSIRYIKNIDASFIDFINIMTKTTDTLALVFFIITIILYVLKTILSKEKKMPISANTAITANMYNTEQPEIQPRRIEVTNDDQNTTKI